MTYGSANFKAINDTYGHAAGDGALRHLAASFKASLREGDVLARLGGEEFAVLLPGTDESGGQRVADKIRVALSSEPVSTGQHTFTLTASFGTTDLSSGDFDITDALRRADAALYAAKHSGRNCVRAFSSLGQPLPPLTRFN